MNRKEKKITPLERGNPVSAHPLVSGAIVYKEKRYLRYLHA
jgi:hypothetical protein